MNFSNDAPSIRCVRLLKHHVDQSYRKKNQTTGSIRLDFQKTTGAAAAAVSFLLPLAVRLLTTSSGETYTIFFKKLAPKPQEARQAGSNLQQRRGNRLLTLEGIKPAKYFSYLSRTTRGLTGASAVLVLHHGELCVEHLCPASTFSQPL